MSAATDMFTETVYVRLLDEGTDVWRPVQARALGDSRFELAHDPASSDETWEFQPGEIVEVERRKLSDGPTMVAVARARVKVSDRH